MTNSIHNARLASPLQYIMPDGTAGHVPAGACMMEQAGESTMDIIWGVNGENSTTLSVESIRAAADAGVLVLLD